VPDESDDRGGAAQPWRLLRGLIDTRWPRCSPFEQHARNGREWLSRSPGGVHESPSIKVIALLSGHRLFISAALVACFLNQCLHQRAIYNNTNLAYY